MLLTDFGYSLWDPDFIPFVNSLNPRDENPDVKKRKNHQRAAHGMPMMKEQAEWNMKNWVQHNLGRKQR